MPFQRTRITALLAAALALAVAATCAAQIPQKMNYQVMLTNDMDEPLANQGVALAFAIFDVLDGGLPLWTETQNVTTNSIGVVSVVLGSVNPIDIDFDVPLWLEIEVGGEILSPRREIVGAPYALYDETGGAGDGHSLDADDGDPTDVVYVDGNGVVTVGDAVVIYGSPRLQVFGASDETAGYFKADSHNTFGVGVFATSDSSGGIVGNSGTASEYYASNPTAVAGVSDGDGDAAAFFALGDGRGIYASSWGAGDALYSYASGTGLSGCFGGGSGVEVELPAANLYPALQVTNLEASWFGDCLHLDSQPGTRTNSHTLDSHCYNGQAGYFNKETNDYTYAVIISSPAYNTAGLYVFGYIYASSLMAREVETSRGKEAVFSVASPEVEMVASGQGRLSAGAARVDFDRTFAESITGPDGLRITATPIGGWSALYVEHIDADGFDLRSESGRTDVEFHWAAVGRAEGHERAPEIVIPDHEEEERILELKEAEMKSRRPPRDRPERPSVVAAENQ